MNNIKIKQFLIFYTICLGCLLSQTYSISGTILDIKTKETISDVNVFIPSSDFGTTTNKEGYFNLSLDSQPVIYMKVRGSIDLSLQMIGYEDKTLQVDLSENNINLDDIFLKVKSIDLESIHIHSHKNESKQISDILINGQELNDNLSGNIATTLSNQPNIGVNSFGVVTSKPVLRGFSGDRFLLTKDGNETGDLSNSSTDHIITLDITNINQIEVIRGPKSLIYGANAIGGVINTTISGNPKTRVDKIYRKIILGGETFNDGLYGNIMFHIPYKNNQFNLLFNNRNTSNQTSPIGTLENTFSRTSNYQISFTNYNKNNYINFIIEHYNMDYGIPPSLEGHINGVDIDLFKKTFQINYHQDISTLIFNQLDIKYNFIDYGHKEFENNLDYFSVSLSKKTNNLKIELNSDNLIIGSNFDYKIFSPQGFYWTPKTDEVDFSLYAFYEREFNNLDFLSSFRLGYISINPEQNTSFANLDSQDIRNRNFHKISFSGGLRKRINKIEINAWLMSTMRAPRVEELFSDGPHLGTYSYEIGEPNLELEKIYGIESSINYSSELLNVSLVTFYNYSPYYHQMNQMGECEDEYVIGLSHPCAGADFIEWGSGSSGWLYKYQTQGVEAVIKGLEFSLVRQFQRLKIAYDFSLTNGYNLTSDLPLSLINPTKQVLDLEYSKQSLTYKVRLSQIHSQDRLGQFESYTPSSFLVDFIIGYHNKNQNITIQFNNVLNEKYYNHLSRIKSIMPEPGRNIVLNYKIFF